MPAFHRTGNPTRAFPAGLRSPAILLLVSLATSCREEAAVPYVQVTDSAGIAIVRSTGPVWREANGWALAPEPRLEITAGAEDAADVLHQVTGVAVIPDGRVAVANRGDNTVRLYSEGGRLLWKAGGSGGGPDEFRDLRGLVLRDEEIWAFQLLPNPAKSFDLDGNLVRSRGAPPVSGPRFRGLLSDGSIVATGGPEGSPSGRIWTQSAPLLRYADRVVDTLAVLPLLRRVDLGPLGQEAQALGPILHVAVGGDLVYAGYPSTWDIGVWTGSGRLIRRIRREWDPEPVTALHRDAYRETLIAAGRASPGLEEAYRQLAQAMIFPDHHPAHDRLLVDRTGFLWVQRPQTEPPWEEAMDYTPVPPHESTWDVFAPDGTWIGTLALPARFRVMDIGGSHVAGVRKDGLDVESVQVWELRRPPSPAISEPRGPAAGRVSRSRPRPGPDRWP